MSPNLERSRLLLEQQRPQDAEEYARLGIQDDPSNALAYFLLASALLEQDREREALQPAEQGRSLDPDDPDFPLLLARIRYQMLDWKKAESHARESLEMYPENPTAFGMLALLAARKAKWEESLELAENGLRYDSDHVLCTNARAQALAQLKRSDQAHDSIDYALHRDPENPYTHYQKGRLLLQSGDYDASAHHFCEALRLSPDFEDAKQGLVEALKGKHLVYSVFLRYIFFMSRLSGGKQMAIVFGGFFAQRIISNAFANAGQPSIAIAIRVIYGVVVFFTWTARSLFNLLLFAHPLGRHALSPLQKKVSIAVAGCIASALVCLTLYLVAHYEGAAISAMAFAATTLPVSTLDHIESRSKFRMVLALSAGGFLCALASLGLILAGDDPAAGPLAMASLLIGVGFTWLSGFFRS